MARTLLHLAGWAATGVVFGLFEATAATFLPGAWSAFRPTFALAGFLLIRNAPRSAIVFLMFAGSATDLFSIGIGTFATARYVLIIATLAFVAKAVLTNHSLYVAIALTLLARLIDSATILFIGAGQPLFVLLERAALDTLLMTVMYTCDLLFPVDFSLDDPRLAKRISTSIAGLVRDKKCIMDEIFGWHEKGIGYHVDRRSSDTLAHEVLFEDDILRLTDRPLFVGHGLTTRRFVVAMGMIFSLLGILGGRAFWMQIHHGAAYRVRAEENRLRVEILPSRRGIIRDRQGVVLAENVPSFDVHLIPSLLPRAASDREGALGALGREIGRALLELDAAVASSSRMSDRLLLAHDISYEQAIRMRIAFADIPSVQVVVSHKRRYSVSSRIHSMSHLLGYVGPISREELERNAGAYRQTDAIGKTGVESSAEISLRGRNGERVYEVDARNRVTSLVNVRPPIDGADLR